ncbi:MAG: UDP-galactopyranose mutase [Candidatus Velthaea sp.]
MYDYLVVGAGLAGATLAERLANELEARVLVVDKREHLAGNCFDLLDENGLRYHRYGPHIFHTNSAGVIAYLSRFTAWRPYEHRVLARVRDRLVPIPINRTTLNELYGLALDDAGAAAFLAARAVATSRITNSEEAIVSRVGRELYELFFRDYTQKHWGLDPAQLDASVCGRIPVRTSQDDRYFSDTFQAMPRDGYAAMVERMLAHPRIDVALGTDYRAAADRVSFDRLVYTGPIDEFFDHRYGRLPYRSLRFEFETLDQERAQAAACINEPGPGVPYTRTTEYKYLTGQTHAKTLISREYPTAEGEPYYPIPMPDSRALYERYRRLAGRERHVTFAGRLAEYRYYNMDQVVASALATFAELAGPSEVAS